MLKFKTCLEKKENHKEYKINKINSNFLYPEQNLDIAIFELRAKDRRGIFKHIKYDISQNNLVLKHNISFITFQLMFQLIKLSTVKLGYNELAYNEIPVITSKFPS